jgi:hypothetical protein
MTARTRLVRYRYVQRHVQGVAELETWVIQALGGVTERSNVAALKVWCSR